MRSWKDLLSASATCGFWRRVSVLTGKASASKDMVSSVAIKVDQAEKIGLLHKVAPFGVCVPTMISQFADVQADAFDNRILNFKLRRVLPTSPPCLNRQACVHCQWSMWTVVRACLIQMSSSLKSFHILEGKRGFRLVQAFHRACELASQARQC